MAITYNAGTNTITVTGYTEGVPCNFTDIWNADQAGGWGVVSKQGTNQFLFDCKLQIGDGGTETWFADTNKQVTFASGLGAGTHSIITVTTNAVMTLGTLIASKRTCGGCSVTSLDSTQRPRLTATTGVAYLYSCFFAGGGSGSGWYQGTFELSLKNGKVYNCLFSKMAHLRDLSNEDLYNIQIQYAQGGLENLGANNTMEKISFSDIIRQDCFAVDDFTVNDLISKNNIKLIQFGYDSNGKTVNIINSEITNWFFTWNGYTAIVYRQYTFNLQVTEEDGTAIQNATVTLTNAAAGVVFSVNTAADGTIAEQTVSRGYYNQANGDTLQDYGPFTLTVTKDGFVDYIHEGIILDEPIDWRIALLDALTGTATTANVSLGRTFYKDDPRTKLTGVTPSFTEIQYKIRTVKEKDPLVKPLMMTLSAEILQKRKLRRTLHKINGAKLKNV